MNPSKRAHAPTARRGGRWAALAASLCLLAASPLAADDDDHRPWRWFSKAKAGVAPVDNPLYERECGGCHFVYQPGLLPARSWVRLMDNLADHFGDNAELDPEVAAPITRYLTENAADRSDHRRSRKISRSLEDEAAPLRITDLPYIRHKHAEIPERYISGNPKVERLSRCDACHVRAAEGVYSDEGVRIPGVGYWEED